MITKSITCYVFCLFAFPVLLMSQQTVRGTILDKDSGAPIPFATIQLVDSILNKGSVSDDLGAFRITDVPLGTRTFLISSVGYEPGKLSNIEVTAGREVVLKIELQESFQELEEVVITAKRDKGKALNDFATVSARTLSMDEANRYAASIGDPARQALNFAGVAGGGDDLVNEIVVRGNSPRSLLWRLEGIEIPNPNHFAAIGSSGGAVSMLSTNVLATSDFYSAAFPGEFGNATSGVFDLKFRKGNNEKHETRFSAGFLGLEFASEGPLNRKTGASYLVNYRYSTVGVLTQLGVNIAGDFKPTYQDISFNLNFPTKKFGVINVYGLGGYNQYSLDESEEGGIVERVKEVGQLGVLGLKHTFFLNNQSYIKTIINGSLQDIDYSEEEAESGYSYKYQEKFEIPTFRISTLYNNKLNARNTIQTGVIWSVLTQKLTNLDIADDVTTVFNDFNGSTNQIQAYAQWKWRIRENLTLNSGLHYLHYQFTAQNSVEPRLGLRWEYAKNRSVNVGIGVHSRAEQLFVYALDIESENGRLEQPNRNLGLSKALHFVLGHDWSLNEQTRLKVEAYYQDLFNVPTDVTAGFSSINARSIYAFDGLTNVTNDGKGRNYGLEFTLERFLHKDFYYLSTISLYQSEYTLNGIDYFNTRFNGNYVVNFLMGKDFKVGQKKTNTIGVNFKTTVQGGQRFTGIDEAASLAAGRRINLEEPFTDQVNTYYRFDIGFTYTFNLIKTTQRLSLNIQNFTNRLNEFDPEYELVGNQIVRTASTQAGMIPVLKYTIDL